MSTNVCLNKQKKIVGIMEKNLNCKIGMSMKKTRVDQIKVPLLYFNNYKLVEIFSILIYSIVLEIVYITIIKK